MPTLESKDTNHKLQLRVASPKAKAELERWEHLAFSFDMDDERSPTGESGSSRKCRKSRSSSSTQPGGLSRESVIANPDLLARIQGAPGSSTELDQAFVQLMSQNQPPPSSSPAGHYSNPLHHGAVPHPGMSPSSSPDFLWNQLVHQQGSHPLYTLQHQQHQAPVISPILFSNPPHNNYIPILVPVPPGNGGGWGIPSAVFPQSGQQPAPSGSVVTAPPPPPSASSTSGTELDPAEDEQAAIAEEKRRRNTAASVRFRIKKKQKTIGLERSVSELTGRADELEKEVADLRRENGWLKEIVMLKSTRHVAQRQAQSGSIQAAGIDLNSDEGGQASTSSSVPLPPRSFTTSEELSSDDENPNKHPKADKKGKGKKSNSKGGRK